MKTVGIIGGFGPETTIQFQQAVLIAWQKLNQQFQPSILTWNAPIPVKIEAKLIQDGQEIDAFLPFLIDAARRLEHAGADFLVLPCNTLHVLFDQLKPEIHVPMLHIVEETGTLLHQQHVSSIGLLATKKSIESNLHKSILTHHNIETIIPSNEDQHNIDTAIQAILQHRSLNEAQRNVINVISHLHQKGAKHIVLGCTDLQQLKLKCINSVLHDSMKILAQATAKKMNQE